MIKFAVKLSSGHDIFLKILLILRRFQELRMFIGILPVKRVRGRIFMESKYDGECLLRDVS